MHFPPPDTDLKSSISRYFCSITKFLSSKTLRFLHVSWLPSGGSHLLDSWGWRGCVYFPDAKRGQTNEIAQHQPEESVERWCTFLGGRGEKIPTTNLQTYTWCNPHDSWINQICCYPFQFGFDHNKNMENSIRNPQNCLSSRFCILSCHEFQVLWEWHSNHRGLQSSWDRNQ